MKVPKNSIFIYLKRRGKYNEMNVDLEEAIDRAGFGKYQLFHCLVTFTTTAAALQELLGYAFVLPAATCDLDIPPAIKGLLTSIPPIGIILTATLWGRAADHIGRKPVLMLTLTTAGVFGITAAFMPDIISFVIVKLVAALFMSCPTSLSYAYVAEMVPQAKRDFIVLMCNGFLQMASVLTPLIAWAVLSFEWQYQLGIILLRPWRLLTAVYASTMILSALWLTQVKESPKWLMSKGKTEETLEVLKHVYAKNTGMHADSYGVKSLKPYSTDSAEETELSTRASSRNSMVALFMPPYCMLFLLLGFLMFGVFSLLNGLYLFTTDTINQVMRGSENASGTLCYLMNSEESLHENSVTCHDHISNDTFVVMVSTTFVYGLIVVLSSFVPVSKKTLLILMYIATGTITVLAGVITHSVIAGIVMSAVQLTGLGIGPISAYTVQIFPTKLRGTAMGGVLMFGRLGSVVGAIAAGYLLAVNCVATFYTFAALIYLCAALCFLLPSTSTRIENEEAVNI